MKKFETYLPVFPGFYGSIFEASGEDSEIDDVNSHREEKNLPPLEYNDFEFNYKEYHDSVSRECVNAIEHELQTEVCNSIKLEFQKLSSPREYNFANDSIHIAIELDNEAKETILKIIDQNKEEFNKHIKERYTSYDGFISSYSNNGEDWIEDLKTWEDNHDTKLSHKIGAVLNFILQDVIGYDQESLYYELETHSVFAENYNELLTLNKED